MQYLGYVFARLASENEQAARVSQAAHARRRAEAAAREHLAPVRRAAVERSAVEPRGHRRRIRRWRRQLV